MFTIAGTKYTLSEVANLIKNDNNTKWHKQYVYYLPKIERSGSPNFPNLADLIMKLAGYRMKESSLSNAQLERARGTPLTENVALCKGAIHRTSVKSEDQAAIAHLMAGNTAGNGVSDEAPHYTDPETGKARAHDISVKEYYINGAGGRRATKRTENSKVTYYYSASHAFNTYQYQLLI